MLPTKGTQTLPAPHPDFPPTLGPQSVGGGQWRFRVWAPKARQVELKLVAPDARLLLMNRDHRGYFELTVEDVDFGARYYYRLDGERDLPDPASRYQPDGVQQPSALVDTHFEWRDETWHGLPLSQLIIYETHIGTFTPQGTFVAAIEQLDQLVELGITAIEIMPVAQFPGERNWGYDGVHPFAVQNSYGGPNGLKQLVDACHARGLAVILDVVFNHLGPEGNHLGEFGDYFTDRYRTPWGDAINFDGAGSDEVRRFFIENALYWIDVCHIDALRLDAVHAIFDFSAKPFLQELAEAVRIEGLRLNRQVFTIAESDLNDSRLIRAVEAGGFGLDAQWSDDLHHAIHRMLTDEDRGYYADFHGFDDIVQAYRSGFVLDGKYSEFRGRRHGNASGDIAPSKFVVCAQNHDQIGNRMLGERLCELIPFESLKLAAGLVLLSPYQPLLFMGEEYAERSPFQYFVSHSDPNLVEAVRRGRREEFSHFHWQGEVPDPQDPMTFEHSKLDHSLRHTGLHRVLRDFYRSVIEIRKASTELAIASRRQMETNVLRENLAFATRRWSFNGEIVVIFHFGEERATIDVPLTGGEWTRSLDSSAAQWNGPGTSVLPRFGSAGSVSLLLEPRSVVVLARNSDSGGTDSGGAA